MDAREDLAVTSPTIELCPEFLKKFRTRAAAKKAVAIVSATAAGLSLADQIVSRLPDVKEGEHRQLKLGSLSILDPRTGEKRFFCPSCKKEYRNANGLKVSWPFFF